MNIETTLPKIEKKWKKPSKEQTRFDLLYIELAQLDKDISELVKLIAFNNCGYKIPQSLFDNYSKILQKLDDLSALNIKKSRHEDLIDCFSDMEDLYFELVEIDDSCPKEPVVIIEEEPGVVKPVVVEPTEEVIEIKEKN